jgi:hypothetical protein
MNWISEQFRRAINQTAETGAEWCVTLESKRDPDCYIQFTSEHVNLAYPCTDDPQQILDALPSFPDRNVAGWEANSYLTLEHGIENAISPMGDFVEKYIVKVLQQTADQTDWTITEQCL